MPPVHLGLGESIETSGEEVGRSVGVSREHGGDPKDVASVSRIRSGDTGDLEGEEETGPPFAARSAVQEKKCLPKNWANTKPAQATANGACCSLFDRFLFPLCFCIFSCSQQITQKLKISRYRIIKFLLVYRTQDKSSCISHLKVSFNSCFPAQAENSVEKKTRKSSEENTCSCRSTREIALYCTRYILPWNGYVS